VKQALLPAFLGWLGWLAGITVGLVLIVAAIGWVVTSPQPLRWVVQNGVLPALAWVGYDDIETSITDVSSDWITLGPTRLGQDGTFEQAQISLNPWSPHFAQAVVWGANLALAEQQDGWVIDPLPQAQTANPAPTKTYDLAPLPNRADQENWWSSPFTLPISLMVRDSRLTLKALPLAEGADAPQVQIALTAFDATGGLSELWSGTRAQGRMTARLSSSAAATLGLAPSEVRQDAPLTIDLSGAWQWENQQVTLPQPEMTATLGTGFAGVGWGILGPLTLSAAPLVENDPQTPAPAMIRLILSDQSGPDATTTLLPHLQLTVAPTQIALGDGAPLEIGTLPLDLSGILAFGETVPAVVRELSLRFQGTTLSLAGAKLSGLQATIDVETDRPQVQASAQVIALPGMAAGSAPLYPLRLDLSAAVTTDAEQPLAETPIPFSLNLKTASGLAIASAQGETLLIDNSGQARLRLEPLTFEPSGLQPEQLLPLVGGTVSQTSGRMSGSGQVRWKEGTISPDISVALDKVSLRHGFLSLEEMTGVLRLTGFSPLRSPKGQEIAIARLQAGLPLANALATYHLDGKGGLVIEQASLSLANGTLSLENSRVQLSPLAGDLPLKVSNLDLAALATYGELDGLSASGTLSGTIPLRLTSSDILIDHGTLSAQQEGYVRYRPDATPDALQSGGSIDLLMNALDDFHYKSLSLTVNGSASGDLQAGLHLNGANPALYGGFPIELNLSLSGALSQLVADTVQTTRVPEHLQKRVEEIMKAPSQ
jgi:hypothetical protein